MTERSDSKSLYLVFFVNFMCCPKTAKKTSNAQAECPTPNEKAKKGKAARKALKILKGVNCKEGEERATNPGSAYRSLLPRVREIGAGEDGNDFVAALLDVFAAAFLSVDEDEDKSDVASGLFDGVDRLNG